MVLKLIVLLTVLTSIQAFAQEDEALAEKKSTYQINDLFKAGSYLIYNCYKSYYTCVDEDGYAKCESLRKTAIDKKMEVYPCAPLKKFETKTLCAKKNYDVVELMAKKRFCYPK